MLKYTNFFSDLCLQEYGFQAYAPSLLAAAIVVAARRALIIRPLWTPPLGGVLRYSLDDLRSTMEHVWRHYATHFAEEAAQQDAQAVAADSAAAAAAAAGEGGGGAAAAASQAAAAAATLLQRTPSASAALTGAATAFTTPPGSYGVSSLGAAAGGQGRVLQALVTSPDGAPLATMMTMQQHQHQQYLLHGKGGGSYSVTDSASASADNSPALASQGSWGPS